MITAHITKTAMLEHKALARRLLSVLSASAAGKGVWIGNAGDRVSGECRRAVTLSHQGQCGLGRSAAGGVLQLAYDDGTSDTVLAASVAAATPPSMPVALDPESLSVLALGERLAVSEIPVLIMGPTGTGKEVVSRFIHECSPRRTGPFIAINCAAMPETMLEALLFGHQKGAFTGANASSEGFFRAADGGTLLLDEVAEMPLALQAKLLRVLQEGEVVPIGSTRPIKVDVRIIACANRDLPTEVEQGRFRADLYYRLNVFPLALRALRERVQDIAPLAFSMALRHTPQDQTVPWISEGALAMLRLHEWPGNIRELENVIRRALLLAQGCTRIEPDHIIFDQAARPLASMSATGVEPAGTGTGGDSADGKLSNIVQISEARAIMATLDAFGGHRAKTARELGISERTLRYRLASFRDAGIAVAGGRS